MISKKELYTYNFILNILGKRILPQFFYEKNPKRMEQWCHQICRQSHILAAYYLDKWLNKNGEINYNIQFCESIFNDIVTGNNYDHSWVWVENISQEDSYICDIARISSHIGFIRAVRNNPDDQLTDTEYKAERIDTIDFNSLLNEKEYYTNMTGYEIIAEIDKRLKMCNLWI